MHADMQIVEPQPAAQAIDTLLDSYSFNHTIVYGSGATTFLRAAATTAARAGLRVLVVTDGLRPPAAEAAAWFTLEQVTSNITVIDDSAGGRPFDAVADAVLRYRPDVVTIDDTQRWGQSTDATDARDLSQLSLERCVVTSRAGSRTLPGHVVGHVDWVATCQQLLHVARNDKALMVVPVKHRRHPLEPAAFALQPNRHGRPLPV